MLVISFIIAFIVAFISAKIMERDARESMYLMVYAYLIFPNILFSLGSFSICFNLYRSVRENFFLSFLSFYFPVIIAFFIVVFYGEMLGTLFILLIALPFMIPQTYYFVRFRKRLLTGEVMEDFYYEVKEENAGYKDVDEMNEIHGLLQEPIRWASEARGGLFYAKKYDRDICWLRINDFPDEPLWTLYYRGDTIHFDDQPDIWTIIHAP